MDEKFEQFKEEFIDEIHINAQLDSVMPDEYFLNDMLDKLTSMGELVDPIIKPIRKRCSGNKIMSFDAYCYDDSDKSIVLITNDYKDEIDINLTKTDIDTIRQRMLNFLQEVVDDNLSKYFDYTDDIIPIGKQLRQRLNKNYVDLNKDDSIDKIKLYILTNKSLSKSIQTLKCDNFLDKKVELNIWGIRRLFDLYQSGRDREPIYIETAKYGLNGIPCIKADMQDNIDYDAYLAIVPGKFLNDIYYDHGSRLLEGNVRVFLSTRGKINKGIRNTIRTEPTKFFAYNNGICCTASKIELSNDNRNIIAMEDLQIINGGQTTASLASAVLKDKQKLDNIFVPMKLTVVKNDEYDDMIQNISKYANSQNKVKDSDLFSNHPFHRRFEELAKTIIAPIRGDAVNQTYWYYERSRGKFENEQFKFTTKSQKQEFLKKYPKNQVIKKEELSKYYVTSSLLRPDIASKGAEKSMAFFAEYIDKECSKDENYIKTNINDIFYKKCIVYTILYRKTDYIVNHAPWYTAGGNKYNIVPYTLAKLIYSLPNGYTLDYEDIWKKQELSPKLINEIDNLARITNDFIMDSKGMIVGEYCKKEETWENYKKINYNISLDLREQLISKELIESKTASLIKDKIEDEKVNIEIEIYKLGGPYWQRLIDEGLKRRLLSPKELSILKIAASFGTPYQKFPSPSQCKIIWKIRKKLEDNGVLVD